MVNLKIFLCRISLMKYFPGSVITICLIPTLVVNYILSFKSDLVIILIKIFADKRMNKILIPIFVFILYVTNHGCRNVIHQNNEEIFS